jgi:AbrB family looped-hinge helix DNA binding protein
MASGNYVFGVCTVNEKGQIVIPKQAREVFGIKSGDSLVLLGDTKKGMALVKTEIFTNTIDDVLKED